jgi:polar amino acid transport system substrate-binding protein
MTLWRTFVSGLVTLIVIVGLAADARAETARAELARQSTLEEVLKRGTLRVGFSTFVPWAMQAKDGQFIGFEIDVARRLAQDMGVQPEFVPTKWDGIIPALLTGKFDIIIGGMGIRPQRNLKVNFSIPYEYSGMAIVAHKDKAAGLKTLADFNRPGVVVAVRLGTTAQEAAENFLPKATIKPFGDEAQAVQELLSGRAHALISSAPLPRLQAAAHPDTLFLPMGDTDFTREPIGFAVRKGDPDFLNFLDNWIRATSALGWLDARYAYWFGTEDWKPLVE